jgi:sugar O-acyltransferase (sialic acid O-acetyltransferase NeuD family)
MLIVGAKGHAKELLDVLEKNGLSDRLFFYDDISEDIQENLYGRYPIIKSTDELKNSHIDNKQFALGIGNPFTRSKMANKFKNLGWELSSVISNNIIIGNYNIIFGAGLNIMHNVFISNDVSIGEGTLVNNRSLLHHDVKIGKYCEISPGVCLTGSVLVGDYTFIGAATVIIPKIKIGKNCIIGAGSVVNKDIPDNSIAVGIPAKVIKEIEPIDE